MTANGPYRGEIRYFAFHFAPKKWAHCDGQLLAITENQALFAILGNTFGGNGQTTFALPDLRGRTMLHAGNGHNLNTRGGEAKHKLSIAEMPLHTHGAMASSANKNASTPEGNFWPVDKSYNKLSNAKLNIAALGNTGNGDGHDNLAPFVSMNACICLDGDFPTQDDLEPEGFIGSIVPMIFSNSAQRLHNWLPCNGQELLVAQFQKLFAIIGYHYGGNGKDKFRLPDLRGRAPIGHGMGEGLTNYHLGDTAGVENVTLAQEQLPKHTHAPMAKLGGNKPYPADTDTWANGQGRPGPNGFTTDKGTLKAMNSAAIDAEGGEAAHNNMMPYHTVVYAICFEGDWPNRN
jgi:microcystin-dependent protein